MPPRNASLLVSDARASELRAHSAGWPSWTVAGTQLAELESLMAGLLWPSVTYAPRGERPIEASGTLLHSPGLELAQEVAQELQPGRHLALKDSEGVLLAALQVTDVWNENGSWRVTGTLEGVTLPVHHSFRRLRLSPSDVAARAEAFGRPRLLAFYPGRVLHAGLREALIGLAARLNAGILLLVAADPSDRDDLAFIARVRALEVSAGRLPAGRALLVITPIQLTTGPAQSATLRAVVARNYGASAVTVDISDAPAANDLIATIAAGQNIEVFPLRPWGLDVESGVVSDPDLPPGGRFEPAPSERQILSRIAASLEVPRWLLSNEEIAALRSLHDTRRRRGFTVFFTGLSGSGKSTIAGALRHRLMEMTGRPVTLLDGDEVRSHLSSELGFSREHRNLNVRRIGWVASEITRHGGMAVCAPIAPYDNVRKQVQAMIEAVGGFALVHVATPLDVCERRDRKGLYARARAGLLPEFTGISDPYEVPGAPAVSIDTTLVDVDSACEAIIDWLQTRDYLPR